MNNSHQSKGGDLFAFAVFLAVATRRSFRGAATELNITPSAVSHSVKALEQRVGVRLINRTTRSVSLTEAGERLAAKLRPAISAIDEAMRELNDLRETPRGTVRINASEGAIRLILRPIMARFLKSYPEVHLDIVTDGRLSDIVGEGFDAGIRLAEAVPQDMVAVPLMGSVRFAAVASPSYLALRGRPTTPQDLYHHDCIRFRFDSGNIYQWEFERHGTSETINVNGRLTLTDQPLMVEAAIDGIGIAFVPDHLAVDALADGRLERVLDDWCPPLPGLCLCYPGHRHVSLGLRALIDMIKIERLLA
ncbi:LysR family transcriptional regulator [Burkholderia cepacia]|uniref:LysR family transcriptional regulator n=1 Tax=Burkholderia cepacia TaxID=292 RepID=A0A2S8J063_BURCE|nr:MULTISPECIES: LysR family transcriptional regulator [Burkholderia cepacia complex]EKS9888968.1 LysR family transcriptional regulator [Burkholderia pyrrocinia]EKS9897695.1 LysR family transcriptional regulator [Burkholderia pyrrocinia]EKS9910326.1 LysR family transcriptional regulator [Burkholderia pyrrocinia]KFL50314.1 LysR family transcriptional regulator [Burkholderia pyrrocinia]PQP20363.1 LysR family transcriptional regulator [Burkholderia cepacia]